MPLGPPSSGLGRGGFEGVYVNGLLYTGELAHKKFTHSESFSGWIEFCSTEESRFLVTRILNRSRHFVQVKNLALGFSARKPQLMLTPGYLQGGITRIITFLGFQEGWLR